MRRLTSNQRERETGLRLVEEDYSATAGAICEVGLPWAPTACPNPAETQLPDGRPACWECADELREIEREARGRDDDEGLTWSHPDTWGGGEDW